MGDGRNFFACAQSKGMMRLGRVNISLSGLIGVPYGSVLEVHPDGLIPLPGTNELYEDLAVGDMDGNEFTRGGGPASVGEYDGATSDNRDFTDTNTAQRMTMVEIEELKKSGASGHAIIQALALNSDTWDKKTAFAKQKWTKKKAHKYVVRVRAVAGNGTNVVQALFVKSGLVKSSAIRPDSIAQLLSYGNVSAGSRVLLFDSYSGVVLGSVLERLGGHGKVVNLFGGAQAHIDHVKYFNLPKEHLARTLVHYPSTGVAEAERARRRRVEGGGEGEEEEEGDKRFLPTAEEEAKARASGKFVLYRKPGAMEEGVEGGKEGEGEGGGDRFDRPKWLKYLEKKRSRLRALAEGRSLLLEGADCLVVACRQDPTVVVPRLMPFLQEGAAFAVYCEFLEPLVALQALLMDAGMLRLQLLSTWWREYQVMPGRSHPNMNMSADGGCVLTGIKVSNGDRGCGGPSMEGEEAEEGEGEGRNGSSKKRYRKQR